MSKKGFIEKEGTVIEALPDNKFLIKLNEDDREVLGYLAGNMRRRRIWISLGDRVRVEFSQYDDNTCRITYRLK